MKAVLIVCLVLFLTACVSSGRYSQRVDSKPTRISKDIDFTDVQPAYEPYYQASLRPYKVLGKVYTPMLSGKGYSATGTASWYGQKFHGHLTANGEVYDMFKLSAAHTTLPLPSVVRVTNLENGKQAVVRVNDRGPFHHSRIIDLSYAAAMKLGMLSTGTAKVKVDIMHVDETGQLTVGNQPAIAPPLALPDDTHEVSVQSNTNKSLYIQVAALSDANKIKQMARGIASLYQVPTLVPKDGNLFRLRLGPFADATHAESILSELRDNGYENAYSLYE
ncbi:septal ring lytic transglycosylase RlpA family protein [Aestuariibacter sp. AA17]|uniref:Endolytic peptidoglycan transglycosylase RlpA n=1 Tax=Fluctibacter corallii TaxID=2984329 RepID=A0ABT3A5N7_9ALTE|nr:septal ring lytic transglycosylase RlpA family protein [Aestuariibacter sp. AA17]MCV2883969.1 septal ring lytic transglycosylase RlpA family protein [Aestuariibacter sp. AA17]